eukprot:1563115-Pleurochrysis_carterae.AAC.1
MEALSATSAPNPPATGKSARAGRQRKQPRFAPPSPLFLRSEPHASRRIYLMLPLRRLALFLSVDVCA